MKSFSTLLRRNLVGKCFFSTKPWAEPMRAGDFSLMSDILYAPSPVGMEAAMTHGVIEPFMKSFKPNNWQIHKFKGHAGIVLDTDPNDNEKLKIMVIGHADKIRMQIRHISNDGKIYVNSDSFIPLTLLGNQVRLFSEDPEKSGHYREIRGGTIEAIGPVHLSEEDIRSGRRGISRDQLYLDLGIHGDNAKTVVDTLKLLPGDPIILDRHISPGFGENTFTGAYLDNGLGCFVMAKLASLLAKEKIDNIRLLFTVAPFEEIGILGSRVLCNTFTPDIVLATDVNFDFTAVPEYSSKHLVNISMGKGFTLSHGCIAHPYLNSIIETTAKSHDIPYQIDVTGNSTGTDAMSGVLSSNDVAATSIGFPIRNMHTISELGHTGDVLSAVYGLYYSILDMDRMNEGKGLTRNDLMTSHPRLDLSYTMIYDDIKHTVNEKTNKKEEKAA